MKSIAFLFVILTSYSFAQQDFAVDIEPISIPNMPGIHSYSWGKTEDGKWIILGGRIDGLHQRQPFAAFQAQDNNKNVYVIDVNTNQIWSADLSNLNASIFEQLQSTNQEFHQRDSMLYIIGGYGFSATSNDHITYPNLTAVSLEGLAQAVINGDDITSYFRQINNVNLKVTGGQLGYLDSTFYLVGGQLFDGRYNPMGPDHGPGFTQQYTNEIRTFKINDDGNNLNIFDYMATTDTVNLHRRDYNMAPQIFPDGTHGFTAFSGVFNYSDMPYLNTVDITPGTYNTNNSFNQYLSQYHCAKLPIYDTINNVMHTVFFGGMSQFTMDNLGNLVEDLDVPFVKTISRISRLNDGSMEENKLGYIEMPTLVGSGAEFIPVDHLYYENEILDLESLPNARTLVGYIYGGIESSAANIFFINDGSQSQASSGIFEVYIDKSKANNEDITINGNNSINLKIFPNPARRKLNIEYFAAAMEITYLTFISNDGAIVDKIKIKPDHIGVNELTIDISEFSPGAYILDVNNGKFSSQSQFVKK